MKSVKAKKLSWLHTHRIKEGRPVMCYPFVSGLALQGLLRPVPLRLSRAAIH